MGTVSDWEDVSCREQLKVVDGDCFRLGRRVLRMTSQSTQVVSIRSQRGRIYLTRALGGQRGVFTWPCAPLPADIKGTDSHKPTVFSWIALFGHEHQRIRWSTENFRCPGKYRSILFTTKF